MTRKSTRRVLSHSLLRLLVRSHRSLIRLLRSVRFARELRCAHSFPRSLTHSEAHGKEIYAYELNASISYIFNPLCSGPRDRSSIYAKRSLFRPRHGLSSDFLRHCRHTRSSRLPHSRDRGLQRGAVDAARQLPRRSRRPTCPETRRRVPSGSRNVSSFSTAHGNHPFGEKQQV